MNRPHHQPPSSDSRRSLAFELFEQRVVLSAATAGAALDLMQFDLTFVGASANDPAAATGVIAASTLGKAFLELDASAYDLSSFYGVPRTTNQANAIDGVVVSGFGADAIGLSGTLHFSSQTGNFTRIPQVDTVGKTSDPRFIDLTEIGEEFVLNEPPSATLAPAASKGLRRDLLTPHEEHESASQRATSRVGIENSRDRADLFELAQSTPTGARVNVAKLPAAASIVAHEAIVDKRLQADAARHLRIDAAVDELYGSRSRAAKPASGGEFVAEAWRETADRIHDGPTVVLNPTEVQSAADSSSPVEHSGGADAPQASSVSPNAPSQLKALPEPIAAWQAPRTESRHEYAVGLALVALLSADSLLRRQTTPDDASLGEQRGFRVLRRK